MPYALLSSPVSNLPTIVSQNSLDYPTMMQMGYVQICTGTQKELQNMAEEMTIDFMELEMNTEIN